jgi:hypothetical protein
VKRAPAVASVLTCAEPSTRHTSLRSESAMPESRREALRRAAWRRPGANARASRSSRAHAAVARLRGSSARSARPVTAEATSPAETAARCGRASQPKEEARSASAPVRSGREAAPQNPRCGFPSGHRWSGFGFVGSAASRYSMCLVSTNETNAASIPYADENPLVSKMRRHQRRILGKGPNLRRMCRGFEGVHAVVFEGTGCTRCDPDSARLECTP